MNNLAETSTPIKFDSITIKSTRNATQVNIARIVTDLTIYEHLDKPYLTGVVAFSDSEDIVGSLDIGGGELVSVVLKTNSVDGYAPKKVEKDFYIDKIITSIKGNDTNEFFMLHLIEDIAFKSNLQNVNKSYSGSSSNIIKKISKGFLGKEIINTETDFQEMKVIVPNLTPLDAMCWIKNKTTTVEGYPHYLFSSLIEKKLIFSDLKGMIESPVSNPLVPFMYAEANISIDTKQETSRRRTILDYSFKDTEDLFSLISKGLIGANHNYIDVTKNKYHNSKFDIQKDIIDKLKNEKSNQPLYSDLYELDGQSFNEYESREVTQLMSTLAYEGNSTYSESATKAQYKLNAINQAMDGLLKKAPLTITVNGHDFLHGRHHSTTGTKIDVRFLRNINDHSSNNVFDPKKSGEYLIFGAKHTFTLEKYTTTLSCVKLFNGEI